MNYICILMVEVFLFKRYNNSNINYKKKLQCMYIFIYKYKNIQKIRIKLSDNRYKLSILVSSLNLYYNFELFL